MTSVATTLAAISKDYQDLLYKNLSDDDEEEEIKESREILKGNGLKRATHLSDEDDEESDDIEDFLNNVMKGGNSAEKGNDKKKKMSKTIKESQEKALPEEKAIDNVVKDVLDIVEKNEKLNEIGGAGADFIPLD